MTFRPLVLSISRAIGTPYALSPTRRMASRIISSKSVRRCRAISSHIVNKFVGQVKTRSIPASFGDIPGRDLEHCRALPRTWYLWDGLAIRRLLAQVHPPLKGKH